MFHICPAKIILNGFNIQLSSDTESEGYFNGLLIHLGNKKKFIKNNKSHYSIIFAIMLGILNFMQPKHLSSDEEVKVGDSDSIPLKKELNNLENSVS